MSHANHTGVTQKDQILKISFGQVHFSKKGQNTKKKSAPFSPSLSLSHALNASATAATTSHHHATPPMLSLL
jgi:hypothetical protein